MKTRRGPQARMLVAALAILAGMASSAFSQGVTLSTLRTIEGNSSDRLARITTDMTKSAITIDVLPPSK